ncbi:PepSY-associated TM helix domain-containing protein [Mucilaginibacter aquatilis]|uniref:PepSY domain-containing protein n=1 Tax=Mucilaginibacter aquatilis TaxID=1517760 RepID=A0A6I4I9L0_9SPHI|nr:PepSY-associated TM helix domain-containing protein [Mucilaginibacter aquatilis]MVN90678.1 PepSY domain-containing protein [Mucilaginibacter aquatilis]
MTAFKKAVLFIHRWLGFTSGLVVFIVSITGCLFCFQDELQDMMHDYRKVQVMQKPALKPSELQGIVLKQFPKSAYAGMAYIAPDRAAQVRVTDKAGYHNVYINQYTGKIQGDDIMEKNFFVIVEFIHLYLLLPPETGKVVVGVAVLIFVALMITGIVLWWPKRKSDRKRSFTVKWNGRWRRINYDLHNVLGFYATSVAIILAITGLSMSFQWMERAIYNAGNIGRNINHDDEEKIMQSDTVNIPSAITVPAMDVAYQTIRTKSPDAPMIVFYGGEKKSDVLNAMSYPKPLYFSYSDSYQFDKHTGKLLSYLPNTKKSPGRKLNDMNYDIHVGQIAGLPGKIIAFLASLICASLPVTGFIIWLGKRNKKPKAKKIRAITHKKSHRHLVATSAEKN